MIEQEKRTWKNVVSDYWVNDGPKLILILIFIAANIAVFLERFLYYRFADANKADEAKAAAAFSVLGYGVSFARGAAAALKLDCALILIFVLRNFLSWLRGTRLNNYLPIDKNIIFHYYIGWVIAFFVCVHLVAHYINFFHLSQLSLAVFKLVVPSATTVPTIIKSAWYNIAGYTGEIAVFSMFLMYTTACEVMRRPQFELFWFTHHLFIVFYGVIIAHGFGKILETPTFWCWVCGPLGLYLLERTIRIIRGSKDTVLLRAIQHPSKVIELQMGRADGWKYKPGQYLFLNCPFIARQEWHPFTISSSPEGETHLSCHIRIVGNWTGKLYKLLNPEEKLGEIQKDMEFAPNGSPILRVDGPFGAASEEVFDYEHVMLVGAGIGVTPFASILKTIRHRLEQRQKNQVEKGKEITIKKVHFYWINRDKEAFEWFSDLLQALERQNVDDFLEINVYLTERVTKEQDIKQMMESENEGGKDAITGLDSKTQYGRPPWEKIFLEHSEIYKNQNIGVFFCGPKVLSKTLYKFCKKNTKGKTRFIYKKENF